MPEKGRGIQSPAAAGADRPRRPPPEAERLDLSLVYEDEWLMAVDKPAGMVVHPTYKNWSGTLLNGLLARAREPRIVTRLDKDTSGVVLVALSAEVHARVQRDGAAGRVTKEYLAIVRGTPASRGSIDLPLARSPEDRRRVVVDPDGQRSRTTYEVLSASNGRAVVRCELVTGRTHQIRVHLASQGWPIVGDRVYGEADETLARQALHAWRVTVPHPVSRETLVLEAPLPPELQALADSVGRDGARRS